MNNDLKIIIRKILPSAIYLCVAGVFFWQSFAIRQTTSSVFGMVSPKTVPRFIIGLLAFCAVLNLISDIKSDALPQAYVRVPAKFLLTAAVFLFASMTAKKLGFLIVGAIFLSALLLLMEDQKLTLKRTLALIVAGTLIAVIGVYAFRYGLHVRLPLYPRF